MSDLPNFEKLTVIQLRESCERRGINSTGLKKELIERLKAGGEKAMDTTETETVNIKEEPKVAEDKQEQKDKKAEVKKQGKLSSNKPGVGHKKTGTTPDELLPDGRPKNLGKIKFQYGYMKMLSMKCVVLYPFKPDIFQNEVFSKYFNRAVNYTIKNTKFSKTSAVILEFHDVDEGDEAWSEINRAIEDDQISVEHPDFHTDSTFWSHRVDTSIDWILKLCVMKEMEFRDSFTKRCLLFENVPENTTHAELVDEFPEANNLVIFGYDPECPGMVGVEMFSERKAEDFMEKYQNYEFKGNKLSLEFYNVRFNRFDKIFRRYRKEHPEPEFAPLSDEERIAKTKDYLALNNAKKELNCGYDYTGTEKIQKCQELSETQVPIARHLFADAKRRLEKGLSIPEPPSEQTAMVKNLIEGKLEERNKRASEGNRIAIEREKKERDRLLQTLKNEGSEKKGKRPASSGAHLSGYPPHKKFQDGRGAPGHVRGRGMVGRGRGMGGMDRGMGMGAMGMSGMDRGMTMGGMNRGMGMSAMNRGMDFVELDRRAGMNHGLDYGLDRGMGRMGGMMDPMSRMGSGMGDGFDDMGGGTMNSVTRTVQALTNKVRELEMLTSQGSGGGRQGGFGAMQRNASGFGHRGHSSRGNRW